MKIKRLHEKAILPRYATEGASAFDLFAYNDVEWTLKEDTTWEALIKTGWAFEIPHETGLFILSRSGHGFKNNASLANSVGLLDYDYRGEAMVKLITQDIVHPTIKAGQAVAQCVLIETPKCYFSVVDELTATERNDKCFGSTDGN